MDGTIQFVVKTTNGPDGPAGLKVTNDDFIEDLESTPPKQTQNIKKYFGKKLTECLDRLPSELDQTLKNAAQFTYPGSGHLEFSDPVMNRPGNLLAKIRYKP